MALRSPPSLLSRVSRLAAFATLSFAMLAPVGRSIAATPIEILASGDLADPLASFGDRLKDALSATLPASLAPGSSGPGVLSAVATDRDRVAFAQRDGLAAFRANGNGASAALEIYGDVPACAVALVRRNGMVRSHADLLAARRNAEPVRVDVGAADGWTAATMAQLSTLDTALAHATIENRGGARALSRVLSGETDVLVVMAYGPAMDRALVDALESGALEPATIFTGNLMRLAALHALPYAAGRVPLASPGMLAGARDHETICTSLGVVVNADANRLLAEAVARIAVSGGLAESNRPWLDNALKAAGRAIGEVRRAAASVAEPGLAWLARWASPAPTTPMPAVRPASNLKDDGQ